NAPRPMLQDIDAVAILHDIQVSAPLGGNAFMTLDSFFSLGVKIFNDIEELLIEEVPGRSVAEVQVPVEEKVPTRARERLQSLAHFYEEFYKEVEKRGFSTRASRYASVSRTIDPGDFPGDGPIILGGFAGLRGAEHRMFTTLAGWPRVRMIFQEGPGIRERMKGLGLPAARGAEVLRGAEVPRPEIHLYSSPDTHGQVFALSAALETADDDTLIVLPKTDSLFPLLRHCLSRLDEASYNVSLRYPLRRTPLYGFLIDLFELVTTMDGERVYLPAYVTFVLHPYVKNMRLGASAESSRVLFHTLEEMLADRRTQRFATLAEIETDDRLFVEAARRLGGDSTATASDLRAHLHAIHERTVESFRSFRNVRDFAERCIALVSWIHDGSTARDHPYFTPFSERFVEALETIARSLMADKSFNDTASYFILLRRFVESADLPFQGTPLHGLQVLGAIETRNLRFARVFILDANEGSYPAAENESTLLPLPVRRALGLPTHRDKEDIAAYHFALLAAGAKELHLFSLESGEHERSRFVERLVWEEQKRRRDLDERSLVRPIQYRVDLTPSAPPPVAKTPAIMERIAGLTFSATSLDAYLQCPLRFYYRSILSLGPRDESTGEIESRDIGLFVHAVLRDYFAGRTGRPLGVEDLDRDAMTRLVEERFATTFGAATGGANRLLLAQL
ncbi:MAG TPA: PD-(D/E)XK nuclease family protein, partial [Spirochaetia bacterium]